MLSASAPDGSPPPALLDAELVGLSLGEEDCGLELEEVLLEVEEEGDSVDVELAAEDVVEELVEELTVTGASEAHEVSRTAVAAVARQAVRRMPQG